MLNGDQRDHRIDIFCLLLKALFGGRFMKTKLLTMEHIVTQFLKRSTVVYLKEWYLLNNIFINVIAGQLFTRKVRCILHIKN